MSTLTYKDERNTLRLAEIYTPNSEQLTRLMPSGPAFLEGLRTDAADGDGLLAELINIRGRRRMFSQRLQLPNPRRVCEVPLHTWIFDPVPIGGELSEWEDRRIGAHYRLLVNRIPTNYEGASFGMFWSCVIRDSPLSAPRHRSISRDAREQAVTFLRGMSAAYESGVPAVAQRIAHAGYTPTYSIV